MKTWDWMQRHQTNRVLSDVEERERAESDNLCNELTRENQLRILSGLGSPKILVGGVNLKDGPSFHTFPMIQMGASIVSITLNTEHILRPDRLYCHPRESLARAIKRLPAKWKPDFFWDSQAEQGHYFPVGLGDVEFPTIVSFNHAHLGQALLHMQGMFDCVIAPSKFMASWGDCVLPWGASWGTMGDRMKMLGRSYKGTEKDITVSCTIGSAGAGKESARHAVIAEMMAIKERRRDWNVFIGSGLEQGEYFDVLARSKVSVNVGTWGSAMTYRPLEIIEQMAALVHVDESGYGNRDMLFESFGGGLTSNVGSLEKDIEWVVDSSEIDPRQYAESNFSYQKQYERLFDVAGSVKMKPRLSTKDFSRRAYAINQLTGYPKPAEVHRWALTPEDEASEASYKDTNWDVCLWQPKDLEQRYVFQTDLAREFGNHREVYKRHSR